MRRREVIVGLGAAAAWPLAGHAQQAGQMRRIGVLMGFAESMPEAQANVAAFRDGLQKRRGIDAAIRQGTRGAAAGCSFFTNHTRNCSATATNAHHRHRFRGRF